MLQHISVELGLDDLSLLDLRDLDPPPALGAGLVMIIGTARSERHLHVSADRFCRWLRSTHQLSPVADGLLGRNELKLKLRRKARRARLLGSVGASADANADDGIKTGWVCVNVGRISVHEASESAVSDSPTERFIGFGRRNDGVRVVVQMMTEEKREEIDLESLWNGVGRQRRKCLDSHQAPVEEVQPGLEEDPKSEHGPELSNAMPSASGPTGQVRKLHTSTRAGMTGASLSIAEDSRRPATAEAPSDLPADKDGQLPGTVSRLESVIRTGDYRTVRRLLSGMGPNVLSVDEKKTFMLRALVAHLLRLPPSQAVKALGRDQQDYGSTPFLLAFYQSFPAFATASHWHCRVQLHAYAMMLGHARYFSRGLRVLLRCAEVSGVELARATFLTVIMAIVHRPRTGSRSEAGVASKGLMCANDLEIVMGVVERMSQQGHDLLAEDVLTLLVQAVGTADPIRHPVLAPDDPCIEPDPDRSPEEAEAMKAVLEAQDRLLSMMDRLEISVEQDRSLVRLLSAFANCSNWPAFWRMFSLPTQTLRARSAALYVHMYDVVARTRHRDFCMRTLRTWIPIMADEAPRVELQGAVAEKVMECIRVIEPDIERRSMQESGPSEWTDLWRRCSERVEAEA